MLYEFLEQGNQAAIALDGGDVSCVLAELAREDADACADFDDVIGRMDMRCLHDGAENFFVDEEMLTEFGAQVKIVLSEKMTDFLRKRHASTVACVSHFDKLNVTRGRYTVHMRRIPVLFLVLFIISLAPPTFALERAPAVRQMLQRREQRRIARLSRLQKIRRFPSSFSSSFLPAVAPDGAKAGSSFSSSPSSVASASSDSLASSQTDPLPSSDVRAAILLLGATTPILGGVRIFHNQEPLDVRALSVDFLAVPASIDSLLVYDGDRRFLGRATLDTAVAGSRRFTLRIANGVFAVPQREERSVYARALLKGYEGGGASGEELQIREFRVVGDGVWSNEEYVKTLTATFPVFQTARARIAAITNAEATPDPIPVGSRQRVAAFRFTREQSDGSAELRVTDLTFQVGKSSDITLSNAILRGSDAGSDHGCTVGATTITCSSIPSEHGAIPENGRSVELYADVTSSGTVSSPFLHITLNEPGTIDTPGHIGWTDGTTAFTWVQFDQPISRGIHLR